jgi:tetratricopeptide (TPR) repeat protein
VAKEARIDQRLRRLPQSLRRVSRALRTLEQEPGRWASSARSLLEMRYAISRLAQGRVAEALTWGHRAVTDAEEAVDKLSLALAYSNLFGIYVAAGLEPDMPYGELALQAYVELEDLPHQADCTNNLAVAALDHNRWPEAVEMFGRAAEIYRRIGDTQGEGLATYNRAEVLVRQGRLEQARSLLDETLLTARAVSDDELVALVLREVGRIAGRRGHRAAALEAFTQAVAVFEEIDEPEEVQATELAACEALLLDGDAAECLARLEALPALEDDAFVPMLHRLRGAASLLAGDAETAVRELAAGLAAAREEDNRYEEALVLLGLRWAGAAPDAAGDGAPDPDAILAALGVIALPVPPALRQP